MLQNDLRRRHSRKQAGTVTDGQTDKLAGRHGATEEKAPVSSSGGSGGGTGRGGGGERTRQERSGTLIRHTRL